MPPSPWSTRPAEDDYRRWRADADAAETQRIDHLSAFLENEYVAGVYEVVDTVDA